MSRVQPLTLTKIIQSAFVLLMVVLCDIWRCGPGCGLGVRLYNECSSRNVRVDYRGRVLADDETSNAFQNLTVKSLDFSIRLTIFAEESHRYLCFNNKWSLVGSKRFRGPMCLFYEEMLSTGYTRYKSVVDKSRYIGFNRRGRPMKRHPFRTDPLNKCLNFIKLDTKFDIGDHNRKVASGKGGKRNGMGPNNNRRSNGGYRRPAIASLATATTPSTTTTSTTTTTTTSTTTTTTPPPPPLLPERHNRIRFRHHRRNRHHLETLQSLGQD